MSSSPSASSASSHRDVRATRDLIALSLALMPLAIGAAHPAGAGTPPYPPNTGNHALNNTSTTLDAADPLSMATGEYFFHKTVLDLGGPMPLRFEVNYGSGSVSISENVSDVAHGGMAGKFAHNHQAVAFAGGSPVFAEVLLPLGRELRFEFDADAGAWSQFSDEAVRHQWFETDDFFYLVDPLAAEVHTFEKLTTSGSILRAIRVRLEDRNGNTHHYTHAPTGTVALDTEAVRRGPVSVHDGLGRQLDFTFQALGQFQVFQYLTRVEDHSGRGWDLAYDIGPADNPIPGIVPLVTLRTLTDPLAGAWTFGYQGNNRVASMQHPAGNTPVAQVYDADLDEPGVLSQTNAFGDTWTLTGDDIGQPGLGDSRIDLENPDGSVRSFFHRSNKTVMGAIVDELGNTTQFFQVPNRRAVGQTRDADLGEGFFTYHPESGLLASVQNNRGDLTTFTFQAVEQTITNPDNGEQITARFFDRVRADHADGAFETFVHDARGNVTQHVDRRGLLHTMTYNGRGQLLTEINPEGGVITCTYDAAGNRTSRTDSDTGTTTFAYDALSRLIQITHPDAAVRTFAYDALDRLTDLADENAVVTRFAYDANSRLTGLTRAFGDPLAQTTTFAYDALDRLVQVTDPAGNQTAFDYPYFDQPNKITFPDATELIFEYDARRLLTAVIDEADQRRETGRNAVGEVTTLTSPEELTLTFGRDAVGEVVEQIAPGGDTTTLVLDELSRVLSVTDPLLRTKSVGRDGDGLVTAREEPEATETAYAYDGNDRLATLTDARGETWQMTHTAMGRIAGMTDPLGRAWQQSYDDRGRPAVRTFADGVTETRAYDAESRLVSRSFSDGVEQTFAYDALDRLVEATDSAAAAAAAAAKGAAATTIELGYDSRDNPTETTLDGHTWSAAFDSRNRLASLDYDGQMTVTYTRDARGLVTRVADDLGGVQVDLAYDDDRRLVQVARSNGTVTDYAYDAKGRLASLDHGTLGRLDFTYTAADEPSAIVETGFPLDPSDALLAEAQTPAFDAADQVAGGGFAYDPRGRPTADSDRGYTWDGAGRLLGIERDGVTVTYRYAATGELVERSIDGSSTRYFTSHAVSGTPLLAEHDGSAFTRFTVTLPDSTPLYILDLPPAGATAGTPDVSFYHYGKVGETRVLSDASGQASDAYAYDGSGRLLARTGTSDQHLLFGGRYGVRHDFDAGLVHMRARWYDADLGRFLTPDPIFASLMGRNGQHANPYHYVEGMATYAVDPSGLDMGMNDLWEFSNDRFENDSPPLLNLPQVDQARFEQNMGGGNTFVPTGSGLLIPIGNGGKGERASGCLRGQTMVLDKAQEDDASPAEESVTAADPLDAIDFSDPNIALAASILGSHVPEVGFLLAFGQAAVEAIDAEFTEAMFRTVQHPR